MEEKDDDVEDVIELKELEYAAAMLEDVGAPTEDEVGATTGA